MNKCKLAVIRRKHGPFNIGDVVDALPFETYLGDKVEPVGGAYVIVIVNNADIYHPTIQRLVKPWLVANPDFVMGDSSAPETIPHSTYQRQFYLRPQTEGDPFFSELLTTGRVEESIEVVELNIQERS